MFVPFRRSQHQRLQPGIEMNGATALINCTSSNSTDDTSAISSRHEFRSAQIDLLQILVQSAFGK